MAEIIAGHRHVAVAEVQRPPRAVAAPWGRSPARPGPRAGRSPPAASSMAANRSPARCTTNRAASAIRGRTRLDGHDRVDAAAERDQRTIGGRPSRRRRRRRPASATAGRVDAQAGRVEARCGTRTRPDRRGRTRAGTLARPRSTAGVAQVDDRRRPRLVVRDAGEQEHEPGRLHRGVVPRTRRTDGHDLLERPSVEVVAAAQRPGAFVDLEPGVGEALRPPALRPRLVGERRPRRRARPADVAPEARAEQSDVKGLDRTGAPRPPGVLRHRTGGGGRWRRTARRGAAPGR